VKSFPVLLLLVLVSGCGSTQQVMRPAPKEGVPVKGLNILFLDLPLNIQIASGVPVSEKIKKANDTTKEIYAEKQRKLEADIHSHLPDQFNKSGLTLNYVSYKVVNGVPLISLAELFPVDAIDSHTLIITPVSQRTYCGGMNGGQSCSTTFTVDLSLRSPKENKELWRMRLEKSQASLLMILPNLCWR
jgi:hypothetical protein